MTMGNVVEMLTCPTAQNAFVKILLTPKSEVIHYYIICITYLSLTYTYLLTFVGVTKCEYPVFKGNGKCDDANNIPECDWDGGDCCGCYIQKGVCSECICKDPSMQRFIETGLFMLF